MRKHTTSSSSHSRYRGPSSSKQTNNHNHNHNHNSNRQPNKDHKERDFRITTNLRNKRLVSRNGGGFSVSVPFEAPNDYENTNYGTNHDNNNNNNYVGYNNNDNEFQLNFQESQSVQNSTHPSYNTPQINITYNAPPQPTNYSPRMPTPYYDDASNYQVNPPVNHSGENIMGNGTFDIQANTLSEIQPPPATLFPVCLEMSGFPSYTHDQEIRDFFGDCGQINIIRFWKPQNISSISALIIFSSAALANKGLYKNTLFLNPNTQVTVEIPYWTYSESLVMIRLPFPFVYTQMPTHIRFYLFQKCGIDESSIIEERYFPVKDSTSIILGFSSVHIANLALQTQEGHFSGKHITIEKFTFPPLQPPTLPFGEPINNTHNFPFGLSFNPASVENVITQEYFPPPYNNNNNNNNHNNHNNNMNTNNDNNNGFVDTWGSWDNNNNNNNNNSNSSSHSYPPPPTAPIQYPPFQRETQSSSDYHSNIRIVLNNNNRSVVDTERKNQKRTPRKKEKGNSDKPPYQQQQQQQQQRNKKDREKIPSSTKSSSKTTLPNTITKSDLTTEKEKPTNTKDSEANNTKAPLPTNKSDPIIQNTSIKGSIKKEEEEVKKIRENLRSVDLAESSNSVTSVESPKTHNGKLEENDKELVVIDLITDHPLDSPESKSHFKEKEYTKSKEELTRKIQALVNKDSTTTNHQTSSATKTVEEEKNDTVKTRDTSKSTRESTEKRVEDPPKKIALSLQKENSVKRGDSLKSDSHWSADSYSSRTSSSSSEDEFGRSKERERSRYRERDYKDRERESDHDQLSRKRYTNDTFESNKKSRVEKSYNPRYPYSHIEKDSREPLRVPYSRESPERSDRSDRSVKQRLTAMKTKHTDTNAHDTNTKTIGSPKKDTKGKNSQYTPTKSTNTNSSKSSFEVKGTTIPSQSIKIDTTKSKPNTVQSTPQQKTTTTALSNQTPSTVFGGTFGFAESKLTTASPSLLDTSPSKKSSQPAVFGGFADSNVTSTQPSPSSQVANTTDQETKESKETEEIKDTIPYVLYVHVDNSQDDGDFDMNVTID